MTGLLYDENLQTEKSVFLIHQNGGIGNEDTKPDLKNQDKGIIKSKTKLKWEYNFMRSVEETP